MDYIYTEPPERENASDTECENQYRSKGLYKLGQIFAGIVIAVIGICFCSIILAIAVKLVFWILGLGF